MTEVELWVMVDENGEYEVSKDVCDLQAEAGLASRLVKIVVMVPTPAAVDAHPIASSRPSQSPGAVPGPP